jgi:hypothetical protein
VSFSSLLRKVVTDISDKAALPDNPNRVHHQFLLQQWRDIEGSWWKEVLMIPGSQQFCKNTPHAPSIQCSCQLNSLLL